MRVCKEVGCDKPHEARGWCTTHYARVRRTGSLEVKRLRPRTIVEPVGVLEFHGWVETETGCWEWQGRRNTQGYGKTRYRNRDVSVHRLAYETWVGPIPDGHVVRHKCDNPPCMNPEHLETGTVSDNNNDRDRRGRNANAKLTEQDVLDIRREYGYGVLTQQMLADVYGLSQTSMSAVLTGQRWRWIE